MHRLITELPAVTDEDIDYLIKCAKQVTSKRKMTPKRNGRSYSSETSLASLDSLYNFQMLIRVHAEFPSNFSVILKLQIPGDDDAVLLRCNGPHGNLYISEKLHARPHIHRLSASEWNTLARKNPKAIREEASYTNITEALHFFKKFCSVSGDDRFFNYSFQDDNETEDDADADIMSPRQIELDDLL